MNKKKIRLTESDLKQIVKESVNKIISEAYGSMTDDDAKLITKLDADRYSEDSFYSDFIRDLKFLHRRVRNYIYNNGSDVNSMNIYLDKIEKDLKHSLKMAEQLKRLEIMNAGEQPDPTYYTRPFNYIYRKNAKYPSDMETT